MKRFCPFLFPVLCLLVAFMVQPMAFAAGGKLVDLKVHSPALEGNLLGDSADRSVIIYLPPSYDISSTQRYPVVCLLHGFGVGPLLWTSGVFQGFSIQTVMDTLVAEGKVQEMIIVMPDAFNKYGGSFYTNSATTGNWEDFITQELVEYIDSNYRTLPRTASRGIAGVSMGGYGAARLGLKYPEVYNAFYSMSGFFGKVSDPDFLARNLSTAESSTWRVTLSLKEINQGTGNGRIAAAAAFSPNPNRPPFFVDFPVELVGETLKPVEPVLRKRLAHMPINMLDEYMLNPKQLKGIGFDCGTSDTFIDFPPENRNFSQALKDLGIPHFFEEYAGGHIDRIPERMVTTVLPFFSEILVSEQATSVQLHGKLATTWGKLKKF